MLGLLSFSVVCGYVLVKFVIFTIKHAIRRRQYWNLPQLPTSFYFGETKFFKKQPINIYFTQTLHEMADPFVQKEKMFVTWIAILPALVTFNREHIKQILSKSDDEILGKGSFLYTAVDDIAPNSLFTVEGSKWRIRRKILSAPFHSTNMENFVEIVNFESARFINFLKKNPCKDLLYEMKKLSMLIFCKLLFEYNLEDEVDSAIKLTDRVTDALTRKAFSVYVFSPFLYRFTSLASEETQIFKELMNFKNRMLKVKGVSEDALKSKLDAQNQDLLGKANNLTLIELLLTNLKDKIKEKTSHGPQWEGFDMDEVRAQLDTFIVAGFDTESVALTFLLYHLAKYPDYQEKIYEEIVQVCGKDPSHELTFEESKQFLLLDAFIAESMRIHPVAPLVSRRTITKDVQLDEKYTVPANTDIVIFIEKVLWDPDYFPDPMTFKPDRFLDSDQKDRYTNLAFSGGVRNCVAKRTALHILNFVGASLLRHYRVGFAPSTPSKLVNLKFELVNKPSEKIELNFVPRS